MTEIGTETRKTMRNLVSLLGWYHYPVRDPTVAKDGIVLSTGH